MKKLWWVLGGLGAIGAAVYFMNKGSKYKIGDDVYVLAGMSIEYLSDAGVWVSGVLGSKFYGKVVTIIPEKKVGNLIVPAKLEVKLSKAAFDNHESKIVRVLAQNINEGPPIYKPGPIKLEPLPYKAIPVGTTVTIPRGTNVTISKDGGSSWQSHLTDRGWTQKIISHSRIANSLYYKLEIGTEYWIVVDGKFVVVA